MLFLLNMYAVERCLQARRDARALNLSKQDISNSERTWVNFLRIVAQQ